LRRERRCHAFAIGLRDVPGVHAGLESVSSGAGFPANGLTRAPDVLAEVEMIPQRTKVVPPGVSEGTIEDRCGICGDGHGRRSGDAAVTG
jgi:hypothetical protein